MKNFNTNTSFFLIILLCLTLGCAQNFKNSTHINSTHSELLPQIEPLLINPITSEHINSPRIVNYVFPEITTIPALSLTNRDLSGQFNTSPSYEPRLIRNAMITNITKVKLDATKGWAAAYFLLQSDTIGGRPSSVDVKFTTDAPVTIAFYDFYKKSWAWSSSVSSAVSPISIYINGDQRSNDGYSMMLAFLPNGTCILEQNTVNTESVTGIFIEEPKNMYRVTDAFIGVPTIEDVCAIPGGGAMIGYKYKNGTSTGKRVEWGIGASPDKWSWFRSEFDSALSIQHIRTSIIGGRLAFFLTDNAVASQSRGTYTISDDSSGSSWSTPESITINGIYCTSMVDNIDNVPNILTYGALGSMDLLVRDGSAVWKKLSTKLIVGQPSSIRRTQLTIGITDPYDLLVGMPDGNDNEKYGTSYFGDTGWTTMNYPLTSPITTPVDGYTNIGYLGAIGNYPAIVAPGNDPNDKNKLALYYSHAIDTQGLNWTTSRRIPNTYEIELDKSTTGARYRFPHAWTLVEYKSHPIVVWVDELQTSDSRRMMRFRCAAALDTEGTKWAGPRAFGETYIYPGDRVEIFAIPVNDGIVVFHEWVSDTDPNKYDVVYTHLPITVK